MYSIILFQQERMNFDELLVCHREELCTLLIIKHFNVLWWNCMQEITKLNTILKNFIERFTTQVKREKTLTLIDTH